MILADTSIWVRKLAGRLEYAQPLDRLLIARQLGGHELVYGELLVGDRGGRAILLGDYDWLPHARKAEHAEVVSLVRTRRLAGRGAGWIDMHLLASVLASGWRLWTVDQRLAELADELGVSWRPQ